MKFIEKLEILKAQAFSEAAATVNKVAIIQVEAWKNAIELSVLRGLSFTRFTNRFALLEKTVPNTTTIQRMAFMRIVADIFRAEGLTVEEYNTNTCDILENPDIEIKLPKTINGVNK